MHFGSKDEWWTDNIMSQQAQGIILSYTLKYELPARNINRVILYDSSNKRSLKAVDPGNALIFYLLCSCTVGVRK